MTINGLYKTELIHHGVQGDGSIRSRTRQYSECPRADLEHPFDRVRRSILSEAGSNRIRQGGQYSVSGFSRTFGCPGAMGINGTARSR
jgi:hypothetical protein